MGLDIYAYATKYDNKKTLAELHDAEYDTRKKNACKAVEELLKPYLGMSAEEFADHKDYCDVIEKLDSLVYLFLLKQGKSPKELYDQSVPKTVRAEPDIYFRKVNCIYGYFQNRGMIDEDEHALATRGDMNDILQLAKDVLAHPDDAEYARENFPTQGGFFFGSTDYDEDYYYDLKDIVNKFQKALDNNPEAEHFVWYFSW